MVGNGVSQSVVLHGGVQTRIFEIRSRSVNPSAQRLVFPSLLQSFTLHETK